MKIVKLKYKVIAIVLLIVFFIPITISSLHHHEDNEHLSCDTKDIVHLHELAHNDCDLYHYQLSSLLLFQSKPLIYSIRIYYVKRSFSYLSFYKNNHQLLRSLRAPPIY